MDLSMGVAAHVLTGRRRSLRLRPRRRWPRLQACSPSGPECYWCGDASARLPANACRVARPSTVSDAGRRHAPTSIPTPRLAIAS